MASIRLSKSSISDLEINAVSSVLRKGYLGMGEEVQLFEKELSEYFNNRLHPVCVSTGTAALQLALQAHNVGEGDEVIVPSLTYVASFQAVTATRAIPIAADVNPETGFICPQDAVRKITSKTKAIMPVHYAGSCEGIEEIIKIAQNNRIAVIEDAAHSFGGSYRGNKIGYNSDTICFSFDGIKNITSGEGGVIFFKNKLFSERAKDARLLGVQNDTTKRYEGKRSWEFDVVDQGWRYHMSNLMAAIGRVQLQRLPEFIERRRQISALYRSKLENIKGIEFFNFDHSSICPHIFPIKVCKKNREKIISYFNLENIEYGIHYKPNHLLSFFKQGFDEFPSTNNLWESLISLPMHFELTDNEIKKICRIIENVTDDS